jgi:predicted nucleotidyltransferase
VGNLYVFGSVLNETFKESSDIDLPVDLKDSDPFEYAENYFSLKFALEDLFQKPIDIFGQKGLKNQYLIKAIDKNKKLVYEA